MAQILTPGSPQGWYKVTSVQTREVIVKFMDLLTDVLCASSVQCDCVVSGCSDKTTDWRVFLLLCSPQSVSELYLKTASRVYLPPLQLDRSTLSAGWQLWRQNISASQPATSHQHQPSLPPSTLRSLPQPANKLISNSVSPPF